MDLILLWIIQLAPLVAFIKIQLLGTVPRSFSVGGLSLKRFAPLVAIAGALAAAVSACALFLTNLDAHAPPKEFIHHWLFVADFPLWDNVAVDRYDFVVGFLVDPLNLLMITIVTTITLFVQIFSFYYMADDEDRSRYFSFLSLFAFSMTGIVLSNNLLQTFLFWELVGLSSYLLIGFWYQKPSAAQAARKAFVINRLADLGFYLGIILLFIFAGTLNFLDMSHAVETMRELPLPLLTLIGILVFMGVMGKSAQFPFHVWLPDAMEGPTPVSALIHSATMVAAGVFLLVRAFPLFAASQTTLTVILVIGTLTAVTSALLATIQRDIKRILAYSTVSQLGLMVMGIGAGNAVAGMFHLATHAYFKSLLFLTAGAFIHHFHSNDIWEIGQKGGKKEKLSMIVLAVGLLSLSGIFPFSGFFSKDMILEALREHNFIFYVVALFVSFLTVYYSGRMFFVIALSKNHAHSAASAILPADPSSGGKASGGRTPLTDTCRVIPLVSLALISLYVGFSGTPLLGQSVIHWLHGPAHPAGGHETHLNWEIIGTTTVLILAALALAYLQFKNPEAALEKLNVSRSPIKNILENKFYIDDLYQVATKHIALRFAGVLHWFDRTFVNELMVNQTSYSVKRLGALASKLQNGLLQNYLSLAVAAGVLILFYVTGF